MVIGGNGIVNRKYETPDGRVLSAEEEVDGTFRTFYRRAVGSGRYRVQSPLVPCRETLEEAQADLDQYARRNRFNEVE